MSSGFRITRAEALAIHDAAIMRFGGVVGVRDEGLLESSLAQPHQSFESRDLYPGVVAKGCCYAFNIICNHPFIDGNKRTGAALLGAYLRMCGIDFQPEHADFLTVMFAVADGSMNYDALVEWVCSVVDEQ